MDYYNDKYVRIALEESTNNSVDKIDIVIKIKL